MKFSAILLAVAGAHKLSQTTTAVSKAEIQELQEAIQQLETLQQEREEADFDWKNALNRGKIILHNLLHKFG